MDWELIWWVVIGIVVCVPVFLEMIGFNWDCFKKDDPYKYCPKGDYQVAHFRPGKMIHTGAWIDSARIAKIFRFGC